MHDSRTTRKDFIEQLARENKKFYGTNDGQGVLRAFELAFEHPWIYLFELVQNALDANAQSIALQVAEDGDSLIFQHDGDDVLDEKDIEGLSKVFRSTKGASSVGFMGIGFKSVFMRFQEARISGWGWKFHYETNHVVGEKYGDKQRDLLGAVVPIWDDAIEEPGHSFSTRFEMRRRIKQGASLKADLEHFLSDNDRTLLAILADYGLKRLNIDGHVWELGIREETNGSLEATAFSDHESLFWRIFSKQFKPSKEAIACFLEHRKILPSEKERNQANAAAARPRRIIGVLPFDKDGMPQPPTKGRVYATLPTEVYLPIRIHINADWLLNISRAGLRDMEDNHWQREMVEPPRVCRRLHFLRGWSNEQTQTLSPGSPGTGRAAGAGAPGEL